MPPRAAAEHPTELVRCRITGYAEQPSQAQVRLVRFDRSARTRRSITTLAMYWGAAVVSILIPVAHFFLVPGFFIYGIVAARQKLRTPVVAVDIAGSCPDCGFAQQFAATGRWNPPIETSCSHCSRRLVIGDCEEPAAS